MKLPEDVERLFNKFVGNALIDKKAVGIVPVEVLEADFKTAKKYFTIGYNCENDIDAIDTCEKLIMQDFSHEEFISTNVITGYNVRRMREEMNPEEFEKQMSEILSVV